LYRYDAKGEAISNAESANYSWVFTRAELDIVEASGIEMKIPNRRKRFAPESIGVTTIKDGQWIDRIINPKAQLSQRDRNQYNDQNVSTDSQDASQRRHITISILLN
jgi:hypothetical protein